MDVKKEFIEELFSKVMQKLDDSVQLSDLCAIENIETKEAIVELKNEIEIIKRDTKYIKEKTDEISKKIDSVLKTLNNLENDFSELKKENREIEQKMTLMITKLKKIENELDADELEDYYALCQSLYNSWEELDSLTQKLLPISEFLYSKLQKYEKSDYSPVILELCRALENELLSKIFSKYTINLIDRKQSNLDTFLSYDRSDRELLKKTNVFVKAVSKAAKTRKPEYTLGQMRNIIALLNDYRTLTSSPLLKDFERYLKTNTDVSRLLSADYLDDLNASINNYRNPSAHPGVMSFQKAKECEEFMPEKIDFFVECVVN